MSSILVDPSTGKQWEFPDDQAQAAQQHLGWSTPEAYAEQQRQAQLQEEHGGQKALTAVESATRQGAKRLSQLSELAGDVDAMGNPIDTVVPVAPEAIAPQSYSPEALERAEANPISAGVGQAAGDLPLYAAAGALTGGLGAGAASALGAGEAAAGVAGAATANVALSTMQEAESAHEEARPLDVANICKNIAGGALLEGAGYGVARGLGAVFGEGEKPLQQAVQRTLDRAGVAGDDLGNPDVLSRARAETQAKIEQAAVELQDAVDAVKPVIANNVMAQRAALRQLADEQPSLSSDIEDLIRRPRQQRYQALLDLRDAADTSPMQREGIDALVTDRSLWGDAAVDHANTMNALEAARAQGPEALVEAARAIKDPTVQDLVSRLDTHFDDQSAYTTIEAFGDQSTVGSAESNYADTKWDKARAEVLSDDKSALTLANNAPAMYHDAANMTARSAQILDNTLKNEFSIAAKHADWEAASEAWTKTNLRNQERWIAQQRGLADDTQLQVGALAEQGFDGKGYGARARKTIADYETRLNGAETPVERAKILEGLKRNLDAQIGKLSSISNQALEEPVRQELIDAIRPLSDSLRGGLEDASLWGRKMAGYQRDANAAWREGIEALGRVFRDLGDREGVVWGETGRAAQIWKADPDKAVRRLAAPLQGGINFQEDLAQASKTIEDLIAAREAYGIKPVNLQQARAALQSMQEANEMASLLAVADRKAAQAVGAGGHAGMNPGHAIGGIAGHFAEYGLRASTGIGLGSIPRLEGQKFGGELWRKFAGALGKDVTQRFGEEGSAVREAVTGFTRRARGTLADLHQNNAIATQVHGFAPEYTQLIREQGGQVNLGEGALRRAPGSSGPGPGAAGAPVPLRPPASTRAVGEMAANETEAMQAARAQVTKIREKAAQAGHVVLGKRMQPISNQEILGSIEKLPEVTEHDFPVIADETKARLAKMAEKSAASLLPEERAAFRKYQGADYGDLRQAENKIHEGNAEPAPDFDSIRAEYQRLKRQVAEVKNASASQEKISSLVKDRINIQEASRAFEAQIESNPSLKSVLQPSLDIWQAKLTELDGEIARGAQAHPDAGKLPEWEDRLEQIAELQNDDQAMAHALVSAQQKTTVLNPTQHGPLYRGMSDLRGSAMNELLHDDEFVTAATTSTSYDPRVAESFAGDVPRSSVILKIESARYGSIGLMAHSNGKEAEVLLPAMQKFRVLNRQRTPNGLLMVTVEHLGEATGKDFRELGAIGSAQLGGQGSLGEFAHGLATSPMGVTIGAGGAALGAYKAYQAAQDYPDDHHARYLASAGARDTTATARALTDPAASAEFARRSAGQPSTLELFQAEHATLQQALTEHRGLVERALRDPSGMVDRLAESFGGLSPSMRDALAARTLQMATYLQSQLPPQRGVSVARPNGLPPSSLEVRTYALKAMAAMEPSTAFDDAKRGKLRHEQVDALKATAPELYDDLRQQTLEAMTAGKSTIQQRQRADLLFGFNSALDPAFSLRLSAAAEAMRRQRSQSTGGAPSEGPAKSGITKNAQPDGLAALAH